MKKMEQMAMQIIKKILLILPQEFKPKDRPAVLHLNPPLGLGYIAATLEHAGYEVRITDAVVEGYQISTPVDSEMVRIGIPFEELRSRIEDFQPDIVGISSMFTMQRRNAHQVAAVVKDLDPNIVVVMGGAHPTAASLMVMEDPNVDYVILAEGDNSIVPFLKTIETGGDLSQLDGVVYRKEGHVIVQKKTEWIQDLDTIPFPARHLLPMEKYLNSGVHHGRFGLRGGNVRSASLITTRGCQYRCNFCTAFEVFTRIPRLRSAENVLEEIDLLVEKFGVNDVFFEDDQFIAKQGHTEEILDGMIARKYNLSWDTPNGISSWLLTDRILTKMRNAGCARVNLAIESGSQYVLDKIINKPVKVKDLPHWANMVRKLGMELGTFIVVGNISRKAVETLEQVRESFYMCRKMKVVPNISYLTPYPGSDVLKVAEEKNYIVPNFSWDRLTTQEQTITTPEWTPEQLRSVVERERLKTELWFKIARPWAAISTLLISLKGNFRDDPAFTIKYYVKRIGRLFVDLCWLIWQEMSGKVSTHLENIVHLKTFSNTPALREEIAEKKPVLPEQIHHDHTS